MGRGRRCGVGVSGRGIWSGEGEDVVLVLGGCAGEEGTDVVGKRGGMSWRRWGRDVVVVFVVGGCDGEKRRGVVLVVGGCGDGILVVGGCGGEEGRDVVVVLVVWKCSGEHQRCGGSVSGWEMWWGRDVEGMWRGCSGGVDGRGI